MNLTINPKINYTINSIIASLKGIPELIRYGSPNLNKVSMNAMNYQAGIDHLILKAYLDSNPKQPLLLGQTKAQHDIRKYSMLLADLYDPVSDKHAPVVGKTGAAGKFTLYVADKTLVNVADDDALKGIMFEFQYLIGDSSISNANKSVDDLIKRSSTRYEFTLLNRDIWEAKKYKL